MTWNYFVFIENALKLKLKIKINSIVITGGYKLCVTLGFMPADVHECVGASEVQWRFLLWGYAI